jgi:hypothetical protein
MEGEGGLEGVKQSPPPITTRRRHQHSCLGSWMSLLPYPAQQLLILTAAAILSSCMPPLHPY